MAIEPAWTENPMESRTLKAAEGVHHKVGGEALPLRIDADVPAGLHALLQHANDLDKARPEHPG